MTPFTHNTVLSPQLRAKVAADSGIAGGAAYWGVTGKSLTRYMHHKY
jgi:hypothetical protein